MSHTNSNGIPSRDEFVEQLARELFAPLYIYTARACQDAGRQMLVADDVLQTFFEKVLDNHEHIWQQWQKKGDGYLYKMIRNIVFSEIRKTSRLKKITDTYVLKMPTTTEIHFSAKPQWDRIRETIVKLFPKSPIRADIIFMYVQGYHYQEIADELELSINTVASHIHRSRGTIQTHFG